MRHRASLDRGTGLGPTRCRARCTEYLGSQGAFNTRKVATLTDDDAHREDFEDRDLLLAALSEHYPHLGGNDVVDVVIFQIMKP